MTLPLYGADCAPDRCVRSIVAPLLPFWPPIDFVRTGRSSMQPSLAASLAALQLPHPPLLPCSVIRHPQFICLCAADWTARRRFVSGPGLCWHLPLTSGSALDTLRARFSHSINRLWCALAPVDCLPHDADGRFRRCRCPFCACFWRRADSTRCRRSRR